VKRSNRLVILVGVLLAVLAFVGVVIVLNSNSGNNNNGNNGPTVAKVDVLVAKADIAIGDPVTPDKVEVSQVDPAAVVGTRFADTSQVSGQRAIFDIPAGSQVSQESLGIGGAGIIDIEGQLKPGEKAIAFQVDRVTGLDFLLRPGDHVDVVLAETVQVLQPTQDTANASPGQQRFEPVQGLESARTVKTILTDKRVLYVSATRNRSVSASPSPGQTAAPASADIQSDSVIIVIAGSDQDAEVIKFAQNDFSVVGPLTAILRRAADADEGVPEETTTGITIDILFSQYGIPVPNIIQALGPSPSPKP
jgi:Flp pilus assembly protein CpaB